jgi:hypothetical protein
MSLPPVEIRLAPVGLEQVRAALKSTKDAISELENSQSAEKIRAARVREGIAKAEADAEVREFKRGLEEKKRLSRSVGMSAFTGGADTNIFGDTRRTGFSNRGLREFSGSMAFEQAFGRTTAMLLGLHGPMGQLTGAVRVVEGVFHGLGSAAQFAIGALSQFGGYLLRDIIRPQLDLGLKSTQLANRMGGGASGAGVRAAINDLYGKNAQADLTDVTKVFEIASNKTKNQDEAKQVAALALQANKAYGFDASHMAEFIGGKRAALPGLSPEQFESFISSQIAASAKGATTPEAFAAQQGKVENLLTRFAGGGTDVDKAARETGIANLLNAATGKGGTASAAVTGLDKLVDDIARDKNHPAFKGAVGPGGAVDLAKALTSIVSVTKGNLQELAGGPKAGTLANVQIGALNKSSIDFIRSLGLADTYKAAGGGAAGEGAVMDQLKRILEPVEGASKLAEDAKKTEADTGYQLDEAFRKMKVTLIDAILPTLDKEGPAIAKTLASMATAMPSAVEAVLSLAKAAGLTVFAMLDVADQLGLLPDSLKKLHDQLQVQFVDKSETVTDQAEIAKRLGGGLESNPIRAKALETAGFNPELFGIQKVKTEKTMADFSPGEQENIIFQQLKAKVGQQAAQSAVNPQTGHLDLQKAAEMLKKAGDTMNAAANKLTSYDPARLLSQAARSFGVT